MISKMTIREVDEKNGIKYEESDWESGLTLWHNQVVDKRFCDYNIEDVCRACRQELHLEYVVPVAIKLLCENPMAGDMYDGELLSSMKCLPEAFWSDNEDMAKAAKDYILQISESDDKDVVSDINEILRKMP